MSISSVSTFLVRVANRVGFESLSPVFDRLCLRLVFPVDTSSSGFKLSPSHSNSRSDFLSQLTFDNTPDVTVDSLLVFFRSRSHPLIATASSLSLTTNLSTQIKRIEFTKNEIGSLKQHVIEEGAIDIDYRGMFRDMKKKERIPQEQTERRNEEA
jgi:hypothetical protein